MGFYLAIVQMENRWGFIWELGRQKIDGSCKEEEEHWEEASLHFGLNLDFQAFLHFDLNFDFMSLKKWDGVLK